MNDDVTSMSVSRFHRFETLKEMLLLWQASREIFPIENGQNGVWRRVSNIINHFLNTTLMEFVRLEAKWLEIEITESILMRDVETTILRLLELKKRGIQISIDDFGKGYSSLSYLKRFPIDILKIDQSFVRDLTTDSVDAAIVKAVITLGRNLNLRVIAEGVETVEQVTFLKQQRCNEMQGYLLSQPISAAKFEKTFMISHIIRYKQ